MPSLKIDTALDTPTADRTSVRMNYAYACLAATLALALPACDQEPTPIGGFDTDGCVADDGGTERVEMVVDCSFSYAGVGQSVRLIANNPQGAGESIKLSFGETLEFSGLFRDDEFDGRTLSVSVSTEMGQTLLTSTLYQMGPTQPPVNEFWGDHGFTGLNYVRDPDNGETLQYACFASDPADPVHEWTD